MFEPQRIEVKLLFLCFFFRQVKELQSPDDCDDSFGRLDVFRPIQVNIGTRREKDHWNIKHVDLTDRLEHLNLKFVLLVHKTSRLRVVNTFKDIYFYNLKLQVIHTCCELFYRYKLL